MSHLSAVCCVCAQWHPRNSLFLLAFALLAPPAYSQEGPDGVWAYEGFSTGNALNDLLAGLYVPGGAGNLGSIQATGFGFENWIVTNKGVGGSSRYVTSGLSYPANYDGSFVATGGSAVISAESGGNATHSLKLNVTALAAVSASDTVWFSFLAERTGPVSVSTADPINETALYPRNFGVRYLTGAGNSNSNIGTLGNAPPSWSVATDEWGQWGAGDTQGLLSFYSGPITALGFDFCVNLDRAGWYGGNSEGNTHPVARKEANAWGLFDMHGNVWEWVWDRHEEYTTDAQTDPIGPSSGLERMLRGGSYNNNAQNCQSPSRFPNAPGNLGAYGGFRPAVSR